MPLVLRRGPRVGPWRRRQVASTVLPTPSAPATPSTPYPADGGQAIYSRLSWVSAGATKFDIYFGTTASPPFLVPSFVGTTYTPTLSASTTYYWKIVAINDGGTATGPVWSFTTPAASAVLFLLDGALMTTRARFPSLSIRDVLGAAPNVATMLCDTVAPHVGQSVTIGLGLLDPGTLLFGGEVQFVDRSYEEANDNTVWPVSLIDYTFAINKRRPFGTFVDQSATTIALYLVATYAPGFTANHVQLGLPLVSINFDGSADFMSCMSQLATQISQGTSIGRTKVDYSQDVHLFLTETVDAPNPVDATHPPMNSPPLRSSTDLSQVRTKEYGKGHGENIPCDIAKGETSIPLPNVALFTSTGGLAIAGTTSGGAQTQVLSYSGVQLGGGASLVGPGATPSVALTATPVSGAGLSDGTYQYAYTDVTAAGESLPSPVAVAVTSVLSNPAASPTAGAPTGGGSVTAGTHKYAVTFANAVGETAIGPDSGTITTVAQISAPSTIPTVINSTSFLSNEPVSGHTYAFKYTFYASNGGQTTPSPASNTVTSDGSRMFLNSDPESGGIARVWYVSKDGGAFVHIEAGSFPNEATASPAPGGSQICFDWVGTGNAVPSSNTTAVQTVPLTSIPLGGAGTTKRLVYRTAAGGAQLKLLTTINDNSTTVLSDTLADASLGVNAPVSNTTAANRFSLSGIATGPATVTSRKVYRTAVNAAQLKLLTTLADNVTTTFGPDTTADAALGANVPTGDTSGLTQPAGQVNAGSTSLPTASATQFPVSGWVSLSGDQNVRYSGVSGNSLTGIPASGPGAITTTVLNGSQVLAAPSLTGINTDNGIPIAMAKGSSVNIWVQREDLAAQVALASIEGGDGIREHTIIEERSGEARMIALCDAELARFSRPNVSIAYCTRDPKTRAGKTVHVDLDGTVGDFLIQDVTITFDPAPSLLPRYQVNAASTTFSFADFVRRASVT